MLVESVLGYGKEGIKRHAEPWCEAAGKRGYLLAELRTIPVL